MGSAAPLRGAAGAVERMTAGAMGVEVALDATRECVMVQGHSVIVNVVACQKGELVSQCPYMSTASAMTRSVFHN